MIPVEALIFDLDGTLIDSKRDLAVSVQFLQKHYRKSPSTEKDVGTFIGDGVVKLVQRALPDLPESELEEAITIFKQFYRKHCLDQTDLYPGTRQTLEHFRRKKMAVVTNKPVKISGYMLDQLDLSRYFKVLIGGDSLPNKKPHPEPILSALKTMQIISPKRVVVIGDSANDVLAGRAAGTHTCGVKSNIGDHQILSNSKPDTLIYSLKELTRIFE